MKHRLGFGSLCIAFTYIFDFIGDPNAQVATELSGGATYNTTGNFVGSLDEKLAFIHAKHTIIIVPPHSSRECRPQTYPCYLTVCNKDHKLVGDKTFRVDHGEQVILEQLPSAGKGTKASATRESQEASSAGGTSANVAHATATIGAEAGFRIDAISGREEYTGKC